MITKGYAVFGWVIHRVSADAGEEFDIVNLRETQTSRLSAQTIYTAGRITGHYADNPAKPALERVPGFATDSLPSPLPRLHLKMQVQEDAVWWCLSTPSNQTLPGVVYIRLAANESQTFPAGSLVFVCAGAGSANNNTIVGPVSVRAQNDVLLTAGDSPVFAMVFDRENNSA